MFQINLLVLSRKKRNQRINFCNILGDLDPSPIISVEKVGPYYSNPDHWIKTDESVWSVLDFRVPF
jgi:hypothetical protein